MIGTSLCGPLSNISPSNSTTFCLRAARSVDTIASNVLLHLSSSISVTNFTLHRPKMGVNQAMSEDCVFQHPSRLVWPHQDQQNKELGTRIDLLHTTVRASFAQAANFNRELLDFTVDVQIHRHVEIVKGVKEWKGKRTVYTWKVNVAGLKGRGDALSICLNGFMMAKASTGK